MNTKFRAQIGADLAGWANLYLQPNPTLAILYDIPT